MTSISTTGVTSVATAAITANTEDALFNAVDKWLSTLGATNSTAAKLSIAAHAAAGLAVQGVSVMGSPLVGPKTLSYNLSTKWSSLFSLTPQQADVMNRLWEVFRQPNIEGITIFTESESTGRQLDVSTSPLIVQRSTALGTTTRTEYATDNAVPRPRTWRIQGHLASVLPATDTFMVVKPSLLMQRNYLDDCMRTRKPVVFKAYDSSFHRVLITNMQTSWDPKSLNTMGITVELVEYIPIEVSDNIPDVAIAALKSIGVTTIGN